MTAHAEKLTLERIFSPPDLSGATLRSPRISPDGRLVAYLRAAPDDKDRMDLWAYDVEQRAHRLLVDSRRLGPARALSTEELARRERQRTSALSGIVEYEFSRDSRELLVPLDGELYLYDLGSAPETAVRRLTHGNGAVTDAHFSPLAHYVSFIRDQNLIVLDLATGEEQAVTRDGAGPISFGSAEFIAQEEMRRTTGYWWSPDESRIAFTRVDESGVPEVERFEIYADSTKVIQQRYPAAGKPNAVVQLYIAAIPPAAPPIRIDLGANPDFYLARVDWFPDGAALAVQRESRDQKTLTLLRADALTGRATELLREESRTWVDLNDDFAFLPGKRLIWGSARSGHEHLYLYTWDGQLIRPLTHGEWEVTGDNDAAGLRGVDLKGGLVYFMANAQTPLERHLYSVSFADPTIPMRRVTSEDGWHAISMSGDGRMFLDTFSTPQSPPSVTLRRADGSSVATLISNEVTADHPYAPYLSEHVPTQFGTLPAVDGQTLYYQILTPQPLVPGHRYPVIVDVYGGPGDQRVRRAWGGYPRSNEGFFRQYLAQHGYVVFSLDNRGTGWRGVRFESALYHQLGSVEVQDQVTGVRFLRTLPYVDPDRIGVFGWSYGGYLALMCMMQAPEVFAAGAAGAPPTDWRLYDTHYTERFMGTPEANPGAYERASVLAHAGNLRGALLVLHGMADDNVLFTNSTALFKRLQDLDRPFEMMTYPGSKHGLLRHAGTGLHAYATISRFFDRALGVAAPAAPF